MKLKDILCSEDYIKHSLKDHRRNVILIHFEGHNNIFWKDLVLTEKGYNYFKPIMDCECSINKENSCIEVKLNDKLKNTKLVTELSVALSSYFPENEFEKRFSRISRIPKNAGYEILHSINLNGQSSIVMGENKDAIEGYQYVTWVKNDRGYDQGSYFGNKQDAYVSLLERSASSIGISLENHYYKKSAFEDIEAIMNTIPDIPKEEITTLISDEHFKSIAYHEYLEASDAEDLQYRLKEEYDEYTSKMETQEEQETEEQEEIEP